MDEDLKTVVASVGLFIDNILHDMNNVSKYHKKPKKYKD